MHYIYRGLYNNAEPRETGGRDVERARVNEAVDVGNKINII